MSYTLLQYYIYCGHSIVSFLHCYDRLVTRNRAFHSIHSVDWLNIQWRDHSVSTGTCHSYQRVCQRSLGDNSRVTREIERVETWHAFANNAGDKVDDGDEDKAETATERQPGVHRGGPSWEEVVSEAMARMGPGQKQMDAGTGTAGPYQMSN